MCDGLYVYIALNWDCLILGKSLQNKMVDFLPYLFEGAYMVMACFAQALPKAV